ncbi:hypothetical protein R6Q59_025540 [Mikania micrantha]
MDPPEDIEDIDDYLREMMEYTLGLPMSARTLNLKIRAAEGSIMHRREQCFALRFHLMERDRIIECIKAESSLNEHALKKHEIEHERLIVNRADLLTRCEKGENESKLHAPGSQALMNFKDQAEERRNKAESHVHHLEDETSKLSEELQFFKQKAEVDCTENVLVDALISTLINKGEVASASRSFLQANSEFDSCKKMLQIWDSLKPSTHNILALASEVKKLQKDTDILRSNLIKAEEEATLLLEENNLMDTENTILTTKLDSMCDHSS